MLLLCPPRSLTHSKYQNQYSLGPKDTVPASSGMLLLCPCGSLTHSTYQNQYSLGPKDTVTTSSGMLLLCHCESLTHPKYQNPYNLTLRDTFMLLLCPLPGSPTVLFWVFWMCQGPWGTQQQHPTGCPYCVLQGQCIVWITRLMHFDLEGHSKGIQWDAVAVSLKVSALFLKQQS